MYFFLVEYEGKIIGSYKKMYDAESFILSCLQNNFMKGSALVHTYRANSCFRLKTKKVSLESYTTKLFDNGFNEETTYSNSSSSTNSLSYESSSNLESSINTIVTTTDTNADADTKTSTPIKVIYEPVKKPVNIDYSNPAVIEMAKQKIDLQHKINLLKKQKEKIEESKNVYENDLKLYKMFKQSKETNNDFVVPELFSKKYIVMQMLELENKLSWENFSKNYQQENYYGDYFSSNSYEDMFVNKLETSSSSSAGTDTTDTIEEEFNINTDSD